MPTTPNWDLGGKLPAPIEAFGWLGIDSSGELDLASSGEVVEAGVLLLDVPAILTSGETYVTHELSSVVSVSDIFP